MEMKWLLLLVALFVYCGCATAELEPALEPLKFRLLEQRLQNDIHHELSDVAELERQLARSLKMVHARKRQLEIKRSGLAA